MKSFKKAQIKTLVEDLDSLLKSKGEIEKKSDFVFEKVKEIQDEVHQKMAKISEEFKLTKDPIINKVNDINQIAELYHQEINRTQIINREMLMDLTRVKADYEHYRRTVSTSPDFASTHGGDMLPISASISGVPGSGAASAMNERMTTPGDENTFLTSVSRHFDSVAVDSILKGTSTAKPQTQGGTRRQANFNDYAQTSILEESIMSSNEKPPLEVIQTISAPETAREAQIRERKTREGEAHARISDRRKTNPIRVKDTFPATIWNNESIV